MHLRPAENLISHIDLTHTLNIHISRHPSSEAPLDVLSRRGLNAHRYNHHEPAENLSGPSSRAARLGLRLHLAIEPSSEHLFRYVEAYCILRHHHERRVASHEIGLPQWLLTSKQILKEGLEQFAFHASWSSDSDIISTGRRNKSWPLIFPIKTHLRPFVVNITATSDSPAQSRQAGPFYIYF